MNDAQIPRFRHLIESRLAALETENERGADARSVVELDQQSIGRLSRMDALQNQAMAQAQKVRRDAETQRLRAALERLAIGEFGYCEDCGDDIASKRLEFDPGVTLCISCASG